MKRILNVSWNQVRRAQRSFVLTSVAVASLAAFENCSPMEALPSGAAELSRALSSGSASGSMIPTRNRLMAGAVALKTRCDDGWVLIPADPSTGTPDFCIMKFEAQNSNAAQFLAVDKLQLDGAGRPLYIEGARHDVGSTVNVAYSLKKLVDGDGNPYLNTQPGIDPEFLVADDYVNGIPESKFSDATHPRAAWTYVTQNEAAAACARIGAHLPSFAEAKAVSTNIALNTALNWSTGSNGHACLFGGHLDGEADPAHGSNNAVLDVPREEWTLDAMYYLTNNDVHRRPEQTNGQCFTASLINPSGNFEVHKNGWLARRTMIITGADGSVDAIWDWSGNASEWMAPTCGPNSGPDSLMSTFVYGARYQPASTNPYRIAPLYAEWTTANYITEDAKRLIGPYYNYKGGGRVPGTEFLNSNWGAGQYYGCDHQNNAIYRGGSLYQGAEGGLFQTHMAHTANFNHPIVGFRCVKPTSAERAPAALSTFAHCANEGERCEFSGRAVVRYGAHGKYSFRQVANGVSCSNDVFGDPLFGTIKSCDVLPESALQACTAENATCAFAGSRVVRYGAGDAFVFKALKDATACNNDVFGDSNVGVVKACALLP